MKLAESGESISSLRMSGTMSGKINCNKTIIKPPIALKNQPFIAGIILPFTKGCNTKEGKPQFIT
jgi:hypothetical protein